MMKNMNLERYGEKKSIFISKKNIDYSHLSKLLSLLL